MLPTLIIPKLAISPNTKARLSYISMVPNCTKLTAVKYSFLRLNNTFSNWVLKTNLLSNRCRRALFSSPSYCLPHKLYNSQANLPTKNLFFLRYEAGFNSENYDLTGLSPTDVLQKTIFFNHKFWNFLITSTRPKVSLDNIQTKLSTPASFLSRLLLPTRRNRRPGFSYYLALSPPQTNPTSISAHFYNIKGAVGDFRRISRGANAKFNQLYNPYTILNQSLAAHDLASSPGFSDYKELRPLLTTVSLPYTVVPTRVAVLNQGRRYPGRVYFTAANSGSSIFLLPQFYAGSLPYCGARNLQWTTPKYTYHQKTLTPFLPSKLPFSRWSVLANSPPTTSIIQGRTTNIPKKLILPRFSLSSVAGRRSNPAWVKLGGLGRSSLPRLRSIPIFTKRSFSPHLFKNFKLNYLGLFFTNALSFRQGFFRGSKYLSKKKLFSFLKPNEVKSNLLFSQKKFHIFRFVTSTLYPFGDPILNEEYSTHNKIYYNFVRTSYEILRSLIRQWPKPGTRDNYFTKSFNPLPISKNNPSAQFTSSPPYTEQYPDVKITRIKFKPGYQKIWRRYRQALKESLQLRFIYQKQLTRYLTHFFRKTTAYTFSQNELNLSKILITSKLLPDLYSIRLFMKHQAIFINGRAAPSETSFLFPEDFIQLELSSVHYIFFKWLLGWASLQEKKFKKLAFQKSLPSKYLLSKMKKQRSYYTPHWVYNMRYISEDIKLFLEVDYLTMSTFILFDPFILTHTPVTEFSESKVNVYRLYNWKYIT